MKTMALLLLLILLGIIALSMRTMAQVEGGGPWIDVDRSGFALAWEVWRGKTLVCRSPFVNTKQRRIECD